MAESQDVLIRTIAKNTREQVHVTLRHYMGRATIDLRIYHRSLGGELHPTSKGVSLDRSRLPELEAALQAAREAIAQGAA